MVKNVHVCKNVFSKFSYVNHMLILIPELPNADELHFTESNDFPSR